MTSRQSEETRISQSARTNSALGARHKWIPETETTSSLASDNAGSRPNIELIGEPPDPHLLLAGKRTAARRQAGPALDRPRKQTLTGITGK